MRDNETVALVPTMGALHEGHLSLVDIARSQTTKTIVTIFVNPTQFGPNEDYATYPRELEQDLAKLEEKGVDAVFCPNRADIYPEGFETYVDNPLSSKILCGRYRNNHFKGVLTIVAKLFNLVQPTLAVFGKKDYQQLAVITKMVQDLNWDIKIVAGETTRESDGLAMSSRNAKLAPEDRKTARLIYSGLQAARTLFEGGQRDCALLKKEFFQKISPSSKLSIEYLEILTTDLSPFADGVVDKNPVMLVACHLGGVRLIDNLEF